MAIQKNSGIMPRKRTSPAGPEASSVKRWAINLVVPGSNPRLRWLYLKPEVLS